MSLPPGDLLGRVYQLLPQARLLVLVLVSVLVSVLVLLWRVYQLLPQARLLVLVCSLEEGLL